MNTYKHTKTYLQTHRKAKEEEENIKKRKNDTENDNNNNNNNNNNNHHKTQIEINSLIDEANQTPNDRPNFNYRSLIAQALFSAQDNQV